MSLADPPFDLITMGRISADLYPDVIGTPLSEVEHFTRTLGGTATNVAVAAARLGRRAAVVTRVGADAFGEFARRSLGEHGVDARWVATDPNEELRTPLAFCEIFPPDHFPLLFYRQPKAPDMNLSAEDLDLDAIEAARIFWTTGTGLSDEPSRSTTLKALDARRADSLTVHDLDYRPMFWRDEAPGRWQREALGRVRIAVGNLTEVQVALGGSADVRDPTDAARALLDFGVETAIVKLGPDGVLGANAHETVRVPVIPVDVCNGLGAGDAFGGALCHALLSGWDLERTLRFANAAGAIVASRMACADAMPTETEINDLMKRATS